jgi:hypothetical protein
MGTENEGNSTYRDHKIAEKTASIRSRGRLVWLELGDGRCEGSTTERP